MNKSDRKYLAGLLVELRTLIEKAEGQRDELDDRVNNVSDHFPDSPLVEQLEKEMGDLEDAIANMEEAFSAIEEAM